MNRQAVFLVCFLAVLAVGVNAEGNTTLHIGGIRVVNGEPTTIDKVPYLVQLRHFNVFFCGGSLISATRVISAAHCLTKGNFKEFTVVAGATHTYEVGQQRSIFDFYLPIGYDFSNSESINDIVVFILDTPVVFNNFVKQIGLCDKPLIPGTMGQVSGWGKIHEYSKTSLQVNTVRLPIVDKNVCSYLYSNYADVLDSMFCAAGHEFHQDACEGDSGGPLVINSRLCGVVSWGRGCARSDSPGVYTDVTYMRKFIDESVDWRQPLPNYHSY